MNNNDNFYKVDDIVGVLFEDLEMDEMVQAQGEANIGRSLTTIGLGIAISLAISCDRWR